jgi:O-antigen/teichoic acid export membrane protein
MIIVNFSYEGIQLWLGKSFADNSSLILQLLAIGVLFNSLAAIPFNFFQGIGKPSIPAIVNLIELPFYLIIMWLVIKEWGINGAAFVWLIRIIIDTALLFLIAQKKIKIFNTTDYGIIIFFLFIIPLLFPFFITDLWIKLVIVFVILCTYAYISWHHMLEPDEKNYMITILQKVRIKN